MQLIVNYNRPELKEAFNRRFLDFVPCRFEYAIKNNPDKDHNYLCYWLDALEFHYRHYIIGVNKNLRNVNYAFNLLRQSKLYKKKVLLDLLVFIEFEIIYLELYELMLRHKIATQKLSKR